MGYCTDADIIDIISSNGFTFSFDDDNDGIAEISADGCISRAKQDIDFYIHRHYDLDSIPANDWLRWCNAHLAACEVFRRLGGVIPDSLLMKYDEYITRLQRVENGDAKIPGLNGLSSNPGMTMDNYHVDLRTGRTPVDFRQTTDRTTTRNGVEFHDAYRPWGLP